MAAGETRDQVQQANEATPTKNQKHTKGKEGRQQKGGTNRRKKNRQWKNTTAVKGFFYFFIEDAIEELEKC